MNRGFRASRPYSYKAIEAVTQQVRQQLGMTPDGSIPDGCQFFERIMGRCTVETAQGPLPVCYSCNSLPTEVEGLTIYSEEDRQIVVSLSEPTYASLRRDEGRARFSACHEFGHAVLHADLAIALGNIPHRTAALHRERKADHPSYLDTEWQANAFAGSLLIPAKGIERLKAEENSMPLFGLSGAIQREFGVSAETAEIRLRIYEEKL